MIVGSRFDGDGHIDSYVMWRQHDVYYQALGIITSTCQGYMSLAFALMDDSNEGWTFIDRYDHRTLQRSHDILAAAWRFRHEYEVRQMELPIVRMCREFACPWRTDKGELTLDRLWGAWQCPDPNCTWLTKNEEPDFAGHWLSWLQAEVKSWKHRPHRIRLVIQILQNQNNPIGYRAEDALSYDLLASYEVVPWITPK